MTSNLRPTRCYLRKGIPGERNSIYKERSEGNRNPKKFSVAGVSGKGKSLGKKAGSGSRRPHRPL